MDVGKVLITGAEGIVGSNINWGIPLSRRHLDIREAKSIAQVLDEVKPDAVLHLGSVNLRDCFNSPDLGYEINVSGTINVAREVERRGITLAYVSTGAVFRGDVGEVFSVEDRPDPVNVYAKSKYLAEECIRIIVKNHIVVRTGWIFGSITPKKTFLDALIEKVKKRESVFASSDQRGSPTHIAVLIDSLKALIAQEKFGSFHLVQSQPASALDVARFVAQKYDIATGIEAVSYRKFLPEGMERSESESLHSSFDLGPWTDHI